LSPGELQALWLTLRLAVLVTLILLFLGTPLAWWLARTRSGWKGPVGAVVALPLVLPPSVLGFYLLLALGPNGPLGQLTAWLGIGPLPFTFSGLVIASLFYSLPFMVQPLQAAFEARRRSMPSLPWRCRWRYPAMSVPLSSPLRTPLASSAWC
jgi:molybdate transport system permease protein